MNTPGSPASRLRVGAVSYLNTKPLVFDLPRLAPQVELAFDLPSRLADDLAARRLDVALIPSVEYFQDASYRVVSNACIACRGPVLSVKLFCRVPPEQTRTLALDEGSRTSAALARVLLDARCGVRPDLSTLPVGASLEDCPADAVLLIGDRCVRPPRGEFAAVWDLGEEWRRWSGLPFVFAMWVARDAAELGDLPRALELARDRGARHLPEIARAEADKVGLTPDACLAYLRDNLHFCLGPREKQGLRLFQRLASALGLAPAPGNEQEAPESDPLADSTLKGNPRPAAV